MQELLSTGIFDWAVTDEDARLAFHIVKAMPREVQTRFREAQEGRWWRTTEGELDQRDANDRDTNLFDNQDQRQQRKLDFQANCSRWGRGQLQTNIEQLCRMSEDQFVEDGRRPREASSAPQPKACGSMRQQTTGSRGSQIHRICEMALGVFAQGPRGRG